MNALSRLVAALTIAVVGMLPTRTVSQEVTITPPMRLHEYLFWDTMGRSAGTAVSSYQDYIRERQLWKDNIEAAKREMENCGGCPAAKAELDKWQGIENQFQDVAGTLAAQVGMPPILAGALGIQMGPIIVDRSANNTQQCNIVRPAWIDQSTPVCREVADKHIACLQGYQQANSNTCYWQNAEHPLGTCWDSLKLYEYCERNDDEGFARQQALHTTRASGKIMPEDVPFGRDHYVLYGPTPDDFVPNVPADIVIADLEGPDRENITFDMKKAKDGLLNRMIIRIFDTTEVDKENFCALLFDVNSDEWTRRQCLDLFSTQRETKTNRMLKCEYTGQTRKYQTDHVYWYSERPATAQGEYLLQRARDHWLLRVGDPRTACPATLQKATAIQSKYLGDLQTVAAQVPLIPLSIVTPEPQWRLDQIEEFAKQRKTAMDKAYAEFKWEGIYRLDLQAAFGGPSYPNTTCEIKATADARYQVSCVQVDYRQRRFEWPIVYGYLADQKLVIEWEPGVTVAHEIALEMDQGKSHLSYNRPPDPPDAPWPTKREYDHSWLTRIGELPVDPKTLKPGQIVGSATNVTGIWSGVVTCDYTSPAEYDPNPYSNVTDQNNLEIVLSLLDIITAQELQDIHGAGVFGKVWGKLEFGPVGESKMPRGSLYVYGTRRSNDITLYTGSWIVQPRGYEEISAAGFFVPENSMTFGLTTAMGCSGNYFKRREILVDPGPMPDAIRARLAAVGLPETYKPTNPGQSPQAAQPLVQSRDIEATLDGTSGESPQAAQPVVQPPDIEATLDGTSGESPQAAQPLVQPPDIEATLDGTWSGQVSEGAATTYPMKMTLNGSTGMTDYPSLGCSGSLTRSSTDGTAVAFRETITRGRNLCSDGGTITVRLVGDHMDWTWSGGCGGAQCSATATLRSQEPARPPKPSSASKLGLTGTWKGTYACAQGLTNLELVLQDVGNGKIWGTFEFSAHPNNRSVPTGKFYMDGIYDVNMKTIELVPTPDKWITRPAGYSYAAMKGTYSLEPKEMGGSILLAGCGGFTVKHAGEATDLGTMPDEVQARLR